LSIDENNATQPDVHLGDPTSGIGEAFSEVVGYGNHHRGPLPGPDRKAEFPGFGIEMERLAWNTDEGGSNVGDLGDFPLSKASPMCAREGASDVGGSECDCSRHPHLDSPSPRESRDLPAGSDSGCQDLADALIDETPKIRHEALDGRAEWDRVGGY
jgi:hypothetical protein